jgi:hypothetical protein
MGLRRRLGLAGAACAGCALAVGVSAGEAGRQPGDPGQPQPGTLVGPPASPALELNPPAHKVVAGETAVVRGHSWFPSLTCTAPVKLSLRDSAGKKHKLGTENPLAGGVSFDSDSLIKVGYQLAYLSGRVRIPEATAPGSARVTGDQTQRFKFLVPPCFEIATQRKSARVEVLPATVDSTVITAVSAQPGARGQPVQLRWRLKRAGRVKVSFAFIFTADKRLAVSTPLDAQRPEGLNTLDVPTLLAGQPLPAGGYALHIELTDPPGSGLTRAVPKTATFRLAE